MSWVWQGDTRSHAPRCLFLKEVLGDMQCDSEESQCSGRWFWPHQDTSKSNKGSGFVNPHASADRIVRWELYQDLTSEIWEPAVLMVLPEVFCGCPLTFLLQHEWDRVEGPDYPRGTFYFSVRSSPNILLQHWKTLIQSRLQQAPHDCSRRSALTMAFSSGSAPDDVALPQMTWPLQMTLMDFRYPKSGLWEAPPLPMELCMHEPAIFLYISKGTLSLQQKFS
jgi:hypothetical protein